MFAGGIEEATSGYNDANFKCASLDMIHWSQGLFGFVASLQPLLDVLAPLGDNRSLSHSTPPQTPPDFDGDLSISSLQKAYKNGLSPVTLVEFLYNKIEAYKKVDPAVWIYLEPRENVLEAAKALTTRYQDRK